MDYSQAKAILVAGKWQPVTDVVEIGDFIQYRSAKFEVTQVRTSVIDAIKLQLPASEYIGSELPAPAKFDLEVV